MMEPEGRILNIQYSGMLGIPQQDPGLIHVSEVGVLLVRYVLESMHECFIVCLVNTLGGQPVTLLVLRGQVPTQEDDVYN